MSPELPDEIPMNRSVHVSAPARLHIGFLDINGSSGRKFGSIGMAINSHQTAITAQFTEIETPHDAPQAIQRKLKQLIATFLDAFSDKISSSQQHIKLTVKTLIPAHAGLGSGTQLAIATGTALCQLFNIDANTRDIAAALARGARSGIGIAAFDHGGFLVDGGLGPDSTTPPLLAHYTYPEQWRIVLIMEAHSQGVHGAAEQNAFKTLPPFPMAQSQAICHLTLMKLLPALVEQNIDAFGESVTEIQNLIGDHFASVQGGRYTSQAVATLLKFAKQLGHRGIAQSSWGPTGCIFVDNEQTALELIDKLNDYVKHHIKSDNQLTILMTDANSTGAIIEYDVV